MRKTEGKKSDMSKRTQPNSTANSDNPSQHTDLPNIEASNLHLFFSQPETVIDENKFDSIMSTVIKNITSLIPAINGFIIKLGEDGNDDKFLLVNSNGRKYTFNCNHVNVQALFNKLELKNGIIKYNGIPKNLWDRIIPDQCEAINHAEIIPLTINHHINGYLGATNKNNGFRSKDSQILKHFAEIVSALINIYQSLQSSQNTMQRHMHMFNNLNQGILIVDRNSRLIFANSGICNMLGYDNNEILKNSLFDIVKSKNVPVVKKVLSGKIKDISTKSYFTLITKNGRYVNTTPDIIPLHNNKGRYIGSIVNIQSATAEKTIKKVLNDSEQKFRDLANLIPLIVFEIDNNGKITFTNSLTAKTMGYSSKELKRKNIFQLLSKNDSPKLMAIMSKSRLINNEDSNYYTALRKDGSEFPVILKMTSIATNGVIEGWRGIIVDLTERERNEARRMELEQKAVVSSHMASIGELASGIAHEVNNPLASIVLYSQLLMEESLPNNIKRDVMSIYESAVRATNIIRRLLTFARQQLQKRTPVNINDIVEVTLELRKYALETSNINVKTILDTDLPLIMADAVQLQEVFLNIILNAETEMKLHRGKGNLQIKTEKSDDKIIVSFTDDGPGIQKDNLSKIFNPFFTTRQVGEGTGLGLSICHGIIIEHGGKIYAESKPRKGATFYIELPIIKRAKRYKQKGPVPTKQKKISRSRILIVDDEIGILDSLSRILDKQGHKVETTDNCVDALEMIRAEKYDYILLDVKLPGMSGIEMFNEIKKHDQSIVNKLAIITGDTMEPATQEFLEYAKVPCFVKPFDTKNFIREINSLINGE